jgi:hypothetical protein
MREAEITPAPSLLLDLARDLEGQDDEYPNDYVMSAVLLHIANLEMTQATEMIDRAAGSASAKVREAAAKALSLRAGLDDPIGFAIEQLDAVGWDGLTGAQRLVMGVVTLIWEVENGGFSQYFVNSDGARWRDALAGLAAIGAGGDCALLKQALAKFGQDGPSVNGLERHHQLARIARSEDEPFDSIEDEFYEDKDDRDVLLLRYIIRHADDFKPDD